MQSAINLVLGFGMAAVGVALPGLINMTSVKISLDRGIRSGIWYSGGAATAIFIQALVAVVFANYLTEHAEIFYYLENIAVVIFLILSIVFLYQALKSGDIKGDRNRGHGFVIGLIVANMNVLNVPYYFAFSTFLEAKDLVFLKGGWKVIFVAGAMLGSFCILSLYAWFAQYIARHARYFTRNINYILSALFFLLSVIQMFR